ncbi:carbon monoxide dehydrogenase [Blastopirellula marina]|uniref:Carbon monoxide dehydrogenase n=1 Tax=Blastopirellula marina TaxID=124 RepID=A0A2S8F656_9BACT|nr:MULTISPECIES: xanthine dehydrogenase family protein subunit M [Pirellulaceae]PQO27649.1 carbon monoxide dehydrogenase [Blastopirellula marina]RCS48187.1 xanthine dehydrogenase family protein subunit M [Bremerella cremea]
MQAFTYHAPRSVNEAVELLASTDGKSVLLAGGTDVLVQLRENLRHADHVIDIKQIPELTQLKTTADGGLSLGSAVTCSQLLHSEPAAPYVALLDAAQIIGGWQIQSRATIGGNLCNSSPAADSVPALLALGAEVEYATPTGTQTCCVSEFCTGPGKNVMNGQGLLVSLKLLPLGPTSGSAYERFIPRYEMDIAVASAGAYIELADDGTIATARIALGAVGPKAILATQPADALIGQTPSDELIEDVARQAATLATPINDMRGTIEFRQQLTYVLVKRTLHTALLRAAGQVVSHHPR